MSVLILSPFNTKRCNLTKFILLLLDFNPDAKGYKKTWESNNANTDLKIKFVYALRFTWRILDPETLDASGSDKLSKKLS